MYKIKYDTQGNIKSYTKVLSHEFGPEWLSAEVPKEYSKMFEMVDQGKRALLHFKVDMNAKDIVIIDTVTVKENVDPLQGKMVKIRQHKRKADLNITFKTINNKPHLSVVSKHNKDRKFLLFLTKKDNINYLYQSFECETNQTNTFEVDQIDYRKVFSNDFSIYYQKIFEKEGYDIE